MHPPRPPWSATHGMAWQAGRPVASALRLAGGWRLAATPLCRRRGHGGGDRLERDLHLCLPPMCSTCLPAQNHVFSPGMRRSSPSRAQPMPGAQACSWLQGRPPRRRAQPASQRAADALEITQAPSLIPTCFQPARAACKRAGAATPSSCQHGGGGGVSANILRQHTCAACRRAPTPTPRRAQSKTLICALPSPKRVAERAPPWRPGDAARCSARRAGGTLEGGGARERRSEGAPQTAKRMGAGLGLGAALDGSPARAR